MKRKDLLLLLVLVLVLFTGCTEKGNPEQETPAPISDPTPQSPPASGESKDSEQSQLLSLVVQRGRDGLREGYQNNTSDMLKSYGIVLDMEGLLWIAPRGGAGIEPEFEKASAEAFPVILESEESFQAEGTRWFNPAVSSENHWVRLIYEPYLPGQGVNAWGHKDLILYIDPDHREDAFLGIQDPQDQTQWQVTLLPGYGVWLEKEIDMLLRGMGF